MDCSIFNKKVNPTKSFHVAWFVIRLTNSVISLFLHRGELSDYETSKLKCFGRKIQSTLMSSMQYLWGVENLSENSKLKVLIFLTLANDRPTCSTYRYNYEACNQVLIFSSHTTFYFLPTTNNSPLPHITTHPTNQLYSVIFTNPCY